MQLDEEAVRGPHFILQATKMAAASTTRHSATGGVGECEGGQTSARKSYCPILSCSLFPSLWQIDEKAMRVARDCCPGPGRGHCEVLPLLCTWSIRRIHNLKNRER